MIPSTSRIRNKIMPPVGMAILILCFIGIGTTYFIQQHQYNDELNMRLDGTYELFNKLLETQTNVLESLAISYVDKDSFLEAFQTRDRDLLLAKAEPYFHEIRQRFNITHFYFHLPDRTCFLRVHDPHKHGDLIDRHTIKFSSKNNAQAYGLELGPLGTLTLRLVIPWRIDGELLGYIELGKEIDQIANDLKRILELEINFVVEKRFLNLKNWQEGRQIMGKDKGDWDFLAEHVVISTTMPQMLDNLQEILDNPSQFHYGEVFNINSGIGSYRGVVIPLSEAGIKNIGSIIILKDFYEITSSKQLIIILSVLTLLTITILILLLYNYLGTIENDLVKTHSNLQEEIVKHERTEAELAEHQKQLDVIVATRTAELEKALTEVKILSGFLPICASCKDIRTDGGKWEQIESYIRDHSEAEFSHSYCPKCAQKLYKDFQGK